MPDYAAAEALQRRGRFRVSLGLERISALLDELGHPERALRGALVAGTNGKGSVVALVAAALREAGLVTGTMPSPHLASYRERVAIGGEPLSERRFAAAVARVMPAVDRVAATLGDPTEFELLTAAAVAEFAEARVDGAVIEVGLGGRLDATNALDLGVAAVTNVQHDHERHLGRSLRSIAGEKAAIIKPGNLAVTGATGAGLAVIEAHCRATGVPLRRVNARGEYRATLRHTGWDGTVVDVARPSGELASLRIGLLGGHQAENAGVAIAILEALAERHGALGVDEAALRRGVAAARWPGRLERVEAANGGVPVVLDGAHNPAGAGVLCRALTELGVRRPAMVFGAIRGKRVTAMLRALAPLEPVAIFTNVPDATAIAPAQLVTTWRRIAATEAHACDDLAEALRLAQTLSARDTPVVVCGSLYLVGAARRLLIPEQEVDR